MLIFRDPKMNKTSCWHLVRTKMFSDKLPYIVDISTKKLHHKLKEHKNRWVDRIQC